jgi:rhodanese-related sulfurtransferase
MGHSHTKFIVVAVIAGLLGSWIWGAFLDDVFTSEDDLIAEFYDVENAVHISPHGLRKHIADDEFTIVDLRSQEEYETAHVVGAVSIPAYASPDKSDYGAVERIVSSFKALPKDKEIVVYCYSMPCMTGRKIGQMLADNGIYVKHLGIGWQEWRYYWNLWNHDGETKVNPADYISSGPEPGVFTGVGGAACPIGGSFGC